MSVALIVRSYDRDFCWLNWAVRCMDKYLSGVDERILITPEGQVPECIDFFSKHVFSQETCHGYIAQQIDKLTAWQHTDCPYLLYVDSDCMFHKPFDVRSRLVDGKCLLYRERWETIPLWGHFWRDVIRRYLGLESEFEYMRAQPFLHSAATVRALLDEYPTLFDRARLLTCGEFSEFNLLGAFAAHRTPENYVFSEGPFEDVVRAYWSHGGLTPEIEREIDEKILTAGIAPGYDLRFMQTPAVDS